MSDTKRVDSLLRRFGENLTPVILFDEIEKAHPDVFNVLLQLMDDGRLTDSQGRTVDFKNVVVIMTSNVGSRYLQDNLIDNQISESARESVMAALRDHFRPEFLNRIDDVVLFKPLSLEEITEIVDLLLAGLNNDSKTGRSPLSSPLLLRNGLEKRATIRLMVPVP